MILKEGMCEIVFNCYGSLLFYFVLLLLSILLLLLFILLLLSLLLSLLFEGNFSLFLIHFSNFCAPLLFLIII